MDPPSLPLFGSLTAECEYWKMRSDQYLEDLMEVKKEYDEFVEQSRSIEIEMDTTLEQKEKKIEELTTKATIYERENEVLVDRLNSQSIEMVSQGNQVAAMTKKIDAMKMELRFLEQKNDDLEQAQRIASESKETSENLLFEQYEKNAMLEVELEEKYELEIELQRLRDEVRELKEELKAKDLKQAGKSVTIGDGGDNSLDSMITHDHTLKADLNKQVIARVVPPKPELKATMSVHQFGAGDSLDSLKDGSFGANMQFLIRKTVADMVSKLDNLQTKLRAHREKRPLPPPAY